MKGIVFTEFLEMVENSHGYELVDTMLSNIDLPSGGVYTAIGTYDHNEMIKLLTFLSEHLQVGVPILLNSFGKYLLKTFSNNYKLFFEEHDNAFSFLESIDGHIHVEVRKIYPEAQLPKFTTERLAHDKLKMIYESERKMSDLAYGLIEETMIFYNTPSEIAMNPISDDGSKVEFTIKVK